MWRRLLVNAWASRSEQKETKGTKTLKTGRASRCSVLDHAQAVLCFGFENGDKIIGFDIRFLLSAFGVGEFPFIGPFRHRGHAVCKCSIRFQSR